MRSGKQILTIYVAKLYRFTNNQITIDKRIFWVVLLFQAATGLSFTVLLTRGGQVYTCGMNSHGQLGHGDNIDRPIPNKVEGLMGLERPITQIAAGSSYTLAVSGDGTLFSFGSCSNFCLAHGDPHDQLTPRAVHSFRRRGVHVIRISAADEHAVALDSAGQVSIK